MSRISLQNGILQGWITGRCSTRYRCKLLVVKYGRWIWGGFWRYAQFGSKKSLSAETVRSLFRMTMRILFHRAAVIENIEKQIAECTVTDEINYGRKDFQTCKVLSVRFISVRYLILNAKNWKTVQMIVSGHQQPFQMGLFRAVA